jgi:hypothetical protein
VSLDAGGWEVADGEPDVGWDVITVDLRNIGEVGDLLADPTVMKVRYLMWPVNISRTSRPLRPNRDVPIRLH